MPAPVYLVPRVVNLRAAPYDVYIGRGSIWGNPYSHLPNSKATYLVQDRLEAIVCYECWIRDNEELLSQLKTLRGKVLGCYCKPQACHGDVLVKLYEELVCGKI